MSPRFAGRTAIITGASRGIGLAVAHRLVSEGAKVVITARNQERLDEAVAQLGGPQCALGVAGRADDTDHQRSTVKEALETFGSLDFLINNAAINPTYGPLLDMSLTTARKVLDVNSVAPLSWVQHAHGAWMAEHGGAMVNLASIAGQRPAPGIGLYGASKATLEYLTEQLALELGPAVRINAVAPAVVRTKFATALYEGREEELAATYPLKRLGTPEDISSVVAFLLSEDAGWMTGQVLVVDGGFTLTGGL